MTIVQSWDTALKGDPSSDYSVGTTWAMDDGNYYLLDLVRVRAAYPELIKTVKGRRSKAQSRHRAHRRRRLRFKPDRRSRKSGHLDHARESAELDKESRLSRVAAMIENGNVNLPRDAHWKDDFMLEVLGVSERPQRRSGRLHDAGSDLDEGL